MNRESARLDERQIRREKFLAALARSFPVSLEKLRDWYCGESRGTAHLELRRKAHGS